MTRLYNGLTMKEVREKLVYQQKKMCGARNCERSINDCFKCPIHALFQHMLMEAEG